MSRRKLLSIRFVGYERKFKDILFDTCVYKKRFPKISMIFFGIKEIF